MAATTRLGRVFGSTCTLPPRLARTEKERRQTTCITSIETAKRLGSVERGTLNMSRMSVAATVSGGEVVM
eukprot:22083-Amphidinium_carterae.1